MRKLHKALVAGTVAAAILVPVGLAVAQSSPPEPNPICTDEQREEHWAVRDQLRAEILDQLEQEGVTDPDELRDELRTRLHDAMEDNFGEIMGPHAGSGMGGRHGEQPLGPMHGNSHARRARR
ncbi:hypothetical protein [Desertimonas flava]|uniref:hypothetical protein n=1 Tax=Desertimonas flava TaxID=2064846 RepID=UPI000E349692|nr:hypothetical protein [Desertimonas flava]